MGKAVEKGEAEAIKDECRLPKSPFSHDTRWGPFRMGLRGEQTGCTWKGEVCWDHTPDVPGAVQISSFLVRNCLK